MSKLFEEAIADAKKLKEVAEENAKKAILESVTPQIREFIEEQLLAEKDDQDDVTEEAEEAEEVQKETLDEEVYLDEGALASLVELIGEENLDSLNESKSQEALFSAVKGAVSTMDDVQREKLLNLSHKLNESANHLSKTKTNKGEDMSKKYYEVDLRALREALQIEEEVADEAEEASEMADPAMEEDVTNELYEEFAHLLEQDDDLEVADDEMDAPDEDEAGDMLSKEEVEAAIKGLMAELEIDESDEAPPLDMPDMPDDLDVDIEEVEDEEINEVFEVDQQILRQELNRIRKMVAEGKVDHQFGGKGGGKAGVNGAYGGSGNGKAGVKGAFGGGKEGQDPFVNPPQINKLNEAIRQLRRKNRSQKEKLTKYRGAVNTLREQLEDLNLFNAKLLYVNKLLQNKSLNENQKKSVIKALDEAQSLTEAKSLYKSLTETFSRGSRETLSESRVLGSSSRPTTSSQSSATSNNGELSRWQRLAGL
tara:strand:+ start:9222 stop:10667 length:1446 start_codon:yes stop_codon:yes gene_type:complete